MENVDVVIVGAGIVGLTLANALKELPITIAVLDSRTPDFSYDLSTYDNRVSAMTIASQRVLSNLHVWPQIAAERISPFHEMHVWDAMGDGKIHFDCHELGMPVAGHIIENRTIVHGLFKSLQYCNNVNLIFSEKLVELESGNGYQTLRTESGKVIRSKLVIGADGAKSWVRDKLNIPLKEWDYQQQAIVTTVKTELPHKKTAWQRFLPTGPLAFLPLDDPHYCSIVWSTTPYESQRLMLLDDDAFRRELSAEFDFQLGRIIEATQRFCFPLRMRHVKHYTKPGFALVGDAAHTIHPLAGQGVNLGILDAITLAEIMTKAIAQGRDFSSMATLRRYERWRKLDVEIMIATMEGFKRLFTHQAEPLRLLRNWGLNLTNQFKPMKNHLMARAMGLSGDLPELAKERY